MTFLLTIKLNDETKIFFYRVQFNSTLMCIYVQKTHLFFRHSHKYANVYHEVGIEK